MLDDYMLDRATHRVPPGREREREREREGGGGGKGEEGGGKGKRRKRRGRRFFFFFFLRAVFLLKIKQKEKERDASLLYNPASGLHCYVLNKTTHTNLRAFLPNNRKLGLEKKNLPDSQISTVAIFGDSSFSETRAVPLIATQAHHTLLLL